MPTFIYALNFQPLPGGPRRYFYVGRSQDVARRFKQHIYLKAQGHEDKYAYIRELERKGLTWDVETLKVIPDGEYPPDNERWAVIKLIREGHDLMNMRYGSAARLKEIAEQARDPTIRGVADVASQRKGRAFSAKKRVQRRVLRETLKREGIPDVATDTMLPRRLRSRAMQSGFTRIQPGMKLEDLVPLLRNPAGFARAQALLELP